MNKKEVIDGVHELFNQQKNRKGWDTLKAMYLVQEGMDYSTLVVVDAEYFNSLPKPELQHVPHTHLFENDEDA